MAIYAKVIRGFILEILESDRIKDDYVDLADVSPIPDVGWQYDGVNFIAPQKKARDKLLVGISDVIDQFTDDEYELYLDIDAYDKKATKGEKQKAVKVKRSRMKLERSGKMPIPDFAAVAQTFVEENILTQERFDEILAALG